MRFLHFGLRRSLHMAQGNGGAPCMAKLIINLGVDCKAGSYALCKDKEASFYAKAPRSGAQYDFRQFVLGHYYTIPK